MSVPNHIAIIPDGNRRWAKAHRLNPWEGHQEGVKRFWDVADAAYSEGVSHLSIWAGSYDNLTKRSRLEVNFLISLLRDELANPKLHERIHNNKSRVQVIGEWESFVRDASTRQAIEDLQQETAHYKKHVLTLLFAYDGQREMLDAVNKLQNKNATPEELRKNLWTGGLPDVDLVIRTGGEPHWSAGFMMWLTANSQFYFTEQLWPEFGKRQLDKALKDYAGRERRHGK
jgi:undecaprenyl diphosphate synthase